LRRTGPSTPKIAPGLDRLKQLELKNKGRSDLTPDSASHDYCIGSDECGKRTYRGYSNYDLENMFQIGFKG